MKLKRAIYLTREGLTLLTALCLLLFASCNNLVETPETKIISEQKYVTVSGSMQTTGALPAVLAMSGLNGQSRTAFPSVPSTGLSYDIKAINTTDNNDIYTGTPSADNSSYTISIPAGDIEKNYKIHITVTKTILGNDYELLKGISESFPINNINPVVSKDITLKPIGEESGILNLSVTIAGSGINSARAIVQFSETSTTNITASREGDVLTFQTGEYDADGLQDGIVAGAWPVTFEFYTSNNCTGQIAFSFTEYVNMFANLTTDTWVQNGKGAWFHTTTDANGNKTTTCIVTAALVDSFKLTQIYVDSLRTTDNPSAATYTKQTGTFLNPKVSFDDAIALVNDASKNYTIYIKGELRGPQTIPATIHANSLTIRGATGLDDSGVPQDGIRGYADELEGHEYDFNQITNWDELDASGKIGTALTVSTDVPVTLRDIKLCDSVASNGGGLRLDSSGEVTLKAGVLITGNKTRGTAGGVYVYGGTLMMTGGKISENSTFHTTSGYGGGVFIREGGSFTMYDGEISGNRASKLGGGVATSGSSFTLEGGKIIGNICDGLNESSVKCGNGGGVLTDYSFTMTGGEISGNSSNEDAGGVLVNGGEFVMTGGKIENNESEGPHGGIFVNQTSVFKLGGDAYIPYNSEKKHFIYLSEYSGTQAKITLISSLNRHSAPDKIYISPQVYSSEATVLEAESGVNLEDEVVKFSVIPEPSYSDIYYIETNGKIYSFVSFSNGSKYGTTVNEDDEQTYEVYKYNYLDDENIKMKIINPYESAGYYMTIKIDDGTPVFNPNINDEVLDDGFHKIYATFEKSGTNPIEITKKVNVGIRRVRITLTDAEIKGFSKDYFKGGVYINGLEVRRWNGWTDFSDTHFDTRGFSITLDKRDSDFICSTADAYMARNSSGGSSSPLRDAYRVYMLSDIRSAGSVEINSYYYHNGGNANDYLTLVMWFNRTNDE